MVDAPLEPKLRDVPPSW